jgi:hypothetical protein
LPALVIKLIKGYLSIHGAYQVLSEAVRTFGVLSRHAFGQCRAYYVKSLFPNFYDLMHYGVSDPQIAAQKNYSVQEQITEVTPLMDIYITLLVVRSCVL